MAKQFTLGKEERLKSRKAIDSLFKEGKSFVVKPFKVFYQLNKEILTAQRPPGRRPRAALSGAGARLATGAAMFNVQYGAGVSSKQFKKAVERNRIKRLMKEAWRLQKNRLQDQLKEEQKKLNIFFIYTGKELPDYKEVYDKTGKIIDKVLDIIITAT